MVEKTVTIKNRAGVHARPASLIVEKANQFHSEILFEKNGEQINGKSIMGVITLGAAYNTQLKIIIKGSDETEAIEAMVKLFEDKFKEE